MRGAEVRLDAVPAFFLHLLDRSEAGFARRPVDDLVRAHLETAMLRSKSLCQSADEFVVLTAFTGRLHGFEAERRMLVATAGIDVVMF